MARIAIVTGAASGIGRALAATMAARGDTVVVADIDGETAERAARELARHGPWHRRPRGGRCPRPGRGAGPGAGDSRPASRRGSSTSGISGAGHQ
jgi:NAD(P)-dependent dehydrogenase (short-subunit alcohol dehydrogenase family)